MRILKEYLVLTGTDNLHLLAVLVDGRKILITIGTG
jgi:hypothetical protein